MMNRRAFFLILSFKKNALRCVYVMFTNHRSFVSFSRLFKILLLNREGVVKHDDRQIFLLLKFHRSWLTPAALLFRNGGTTDIFLIFYENKNGRDRKIQLPRGALKAAFTHRHQGSILLENHPPLLLSSNCGNKYAWHGILSHRKCGERKVKRFWSVLKKLRKLSQEKHSDFVVTCCRWRWLDFRLLGLDHQARF